MAKCIAAVKRGYPEKEGPFVKILDNALQSFDVVGHLLAIMSTRHYR